MNMAINLSTLVKPLTVSLALWFLQPLSAVAALITFNDLFETGVTVSVTDPNLDNTPNRVTFTCPSLEQCIVEVAPPPGYIQGTTGPSSINIFEPNNPTVVSDTILLGHPTDNPDNVTVTFTSDTEGVPLAAIPGAQVFLEDGAIRGGPVIGWLHEGSPNIFDNFSYASNVEPAPEPGTLALLGIGAAGLGWRRRKQ